MQSIIVLYIVLLAIVVVLLYVGRKFSATNRTVQKRSWTNLFRNFYKISVPKDRPRTSVVRVRTASANHPTPDEMDRVLQVLDDLYEDLHGEIEKMNVQWKETVEELTRRTERMERTLAELQVGITNGDRNEPGVSGLTSESLSRQTLASKIEELPKEAADRQEAADKQSSASGQKVSGRTSAELPLSEVHFEALRRVQLGEAIDDVAESLGIGTGELQVVLRLATTS